MPKMTVLEMTQSILSDMDSDSVNSLSDTTEATQVADVIKQTYYHLITNENLLKHKRVSSLTALGDTDHPNYMKIPTNVSRIEVLKYDVREDPADKLDYRDISYMLPEDFMDMVIARNSEADNVETITDFNGCPILVINDKAPEAWTTFDNNYVVFDSYNSNVEATLQQSKSMCYVTADPAWTDGDDDFIPDLDANMFPMLLNEAKSMCFINFKQMVNEKVEQYSRRQKLKARDHDTRLDHLRDNTPDYGRRK